MTVIQLFYLRIWKMKMNHTALTDLIPKVPTYGNLGLMILGVELFQLEEMILLTSLIAMGIWIMFPPKNQKKKIEAKILQCSDYKIDVSVLDHGGSYSLSYTPIVAGSFSIEICVDGIPISGYLNPLHIVVVPGSPDPTKCAITGDGFHTAIIGEENSFQILSRDSYQNIIYDGGAQIQGTLLIDSENYLDIKIIDRDDGQYTCIYHIANTVKPGTYQMLLSMNGEPMFDNSIPIEVSAQLNQTILETKEPLGKETTELDKEKKEEITHEKIVIHKSFKHS